MVVAACHGHVSYCSLPVQMSQENIDILDHANSNSECDAFVGTRGVSQVIFGIREDNTDSKTVWMEPPYRLTALYMARIMQEAISRSWL